MRKKNQLPSLEKLIPRRSSTFCSKLENHFLINDPNSERASKLQRQLHNCLEIVNYVKKKEGKISRVAKFGTDDYIVERKEATQNENEICEIPWPFTANTYCRDDSDDEGDFGTTSQTVQTIIR
ncbi:hypothetical protein TNCV_1545521 [Trichonephila clavipes]|nr:hypothetical protein TNCV_1545521 [Trichonephila clavipes]